MADEALDLTPPTKAAKAPKAAKVAKEPKEPKAPKEVKPVELDAEGNPVKKARGPKKEYGYSKDSVIHLVPEKVTAYRGQRAEWFEILKQFDGKLVRDFNAAAAGRPNGKGTIQNPSGWLRFYCLDGSVTLEAPAAKAAE